MFLNVIAFSKLKWKDLACPEIILVYVSLFILKNDLQPQNFSKLRESIWHYNFDLIIYNIL